MTKITENMVNEVISEIKAIMGDTNGEVIHQRVKKNNGVELNGITIREVGNAVAPTMYIEGFVKDDDFDARYIAKEILTALANTDVPKFDVSFLTDFEKVKDELSIRLINFDANIEMLSTHPHECYLDLAIICVIDVGGGSIKINNDLLKTWGVERMELLDIARKNAPKINPVSGRNMFDIMMGGAGYKSGGLDKIDLTMQPMYMLTNTDTAYGAATILYDGVLEELAEQVNSDLIILPSSVHEVIIIPYESTDMDINELSSMIREINGNEVEPEEVLSGHPYIYRRDIKRIICG